MQRVKVHLMKKDTIETRLAKARALLGLPETGEIAGEGLRSAYRARLRAAHPDTGGDIAGAPVSLAEIQQAYTLLLRAAQETPRCSRCGGSGVLRHRSFVTKCRECGGTGELE